MARRTKLIDALIVAASAIAEEVVKYMADIIRKRRKQ